MLKKTAFIGLIFFIILKLTDAQKKYSLTIFNCKNNNDIQSLISYKKYFSDTLQRKKEIQNVILSFWEKGFITASCDSLLRDSLCLKAYINIGIKYKYFLVNIDKLDHSFPEKRYFLKKELKNYFFNYKTIEKQMNQLIVFYENNGFPFVNVQFDSISLKDSAFIGNIVVKKNNKYSIDSILIKGNALSSKGFVQNYLGIKINSLYNESAIKKIPKKIQELDFVKEIKPFEIEFYENKAKILLFLDKVKANQFDGIIGFMPNDEGKLLITGESNLLLINSFNRGEMIGFKWHKFDKFSQDLKISISYPYLLSSPFGVDVDFSLYKKDTSYVTTKGNFGFKFIFEGNNSLKAFYEKQHTSLLSENILGKDSILPIYNASKINLYGLELKVQNINKHINPRKGYLIKIMASTGNKEILKNRKLKDAVYNNMTLNSSQYVYDTEIDYFIPVLRRSCLFLNTKSAMIYSKYLFDNEVFKIGGLKTIRGFDEESIPASFYTILTAEYRYLYDEYSYLCIFCNGCHYEKNTINKYNSGNLFGFGVGINFKTKLGVFSFNYALGKNENEPIYYRKAKIHFGIINYF